VGCGKRERNARKMEVHQHPYSHPSFHACPIHTPYSQCLWEVLVRGFGVLFLACVCVCRCRVCCSLSVCVCLCELLIFLQVGGAACFPRLTRGQSVFTSLVSHLSYSHPLFTGVLCAFSPDGRFRIFGGFGLTRG